MGATHKVYVCVQILEYHVVPNQVLHAADFTQGEVLNTVLNQTLSVRTPLTKTPLRGTPHHTCAQAHVKQAFRHSLMPMQRTPDELYFT